MGTRVSYPVEVKEDAIRLRMAGVRVAEVMERLGIKNSSQLRIWMNGIETVKYIVFNNQLENNIRQDYVLSL